MQFDTYYQTIRRQQKRDALLWSSLILFCYLTAGYYAEFSLTNLLTNAPHFFDYLHEILPQLSWETLFAPRGEDGRAVAGSLIYWGYRLPIQLPLLWETLNISLAATLLASAIALLLAFLAAGNGYAPPSVRLAVRTLAAFLRTMPELAWALMFVMAYGIGTFPGFIALMLHSVGSLTKLFYEAVESASNKPVRGLDSCGATTLQKVRFGLWPQVKPGLISYMFLRFEVNFRASTILGLVGAGGIGQELMTNISLDRYDQVSMTLLLIVISVGLIDSVSGYLRRKIVQGE